MGAASEEVGRFVASTPLAASAALSLGPFHRPLSPYGGGHPPPTSLGSMPSSTLAIRVALQSAGRTARQLLNVMLWWGGSITADTLAAETEAADRTEIEGALERLVHAGLVIAPSEAKPEWRVTPGARELLAPIGISMHHQNAITSDALARICKRLGIQAASRKDERISAIASAFSDASRRAQILGGIDDDARALMDLIAELGPLPAALATLGIYSGDLYSATVPSYAGTRRQPPPELAPLAELVGLGIVGLDPWERRAWIWREAWPLLDRPLYPVWPSPGRPSTAPTQPSAPRLPPLVATYERALRRWDESPPPALKNGEARLAKKDVRSTAKDLSADPEAIELIATTALGLGLFLRNVVATSGRGRNRRVDEAWLADPDLRGAWDKTPAPARWTRVVAEWANPRDPASEQEVANRHLVLWELASLPPGQGFADDIALARWIEHRYLPTGAAELAAAALGDLRLLGVANPAGPAGLTELGRQVIEDPQALRHVELGTGDRATVQADLSIVCPPDLDPDLLIQISEVAVLESDAGASVFRLDEDLITNAVQGGREEAEIVQFLESLSPVPVPDTVRRLVADGAARVGRVRVATTTTVVVTDDPADLARACKVGPAKLTALSPTVASSPLPSEKVRQALARKGLAPLLVNAEEQRSPRRSTEEASNLERLAEARRRLARHIGNPAVTADAERFEAAARAARDPSLRLAVKGPIAATPDLVARLT